MPSLIESLKYRLPKSGNLDSRFNRADLLKAGSESNYDRLVFVNQMGFGLVDSLHLPVGSWAIWNRPNFAIPNFPEGETVTHSRLGLYYSRGNEDPSHNGAILRMSYEPVTEEEFKRDLASFTKYYIERPRVWGFPSRLMTADGWQYPVAIGGGAVLGSAIGVLTEGTGTIFTNWVNLAYPLTGIIGALHASSELWAKRHIPALNQYMSGQTAESTLVTEQNRIIEVLIQRELYAALQNEDITITPEDFVGKIYRQMPYSLRQRRAAEITSVRTAGSDSDKIPEVALPHMLGVAKAILAIA